MKHKTIRPIITIALIIYTVSFLVYGKYLASSETPPLESIFEEIKSEFYLQYLSTGKVPTNLSFLSPRATRLMSVYSDSFTWDELTQSLCYTYDRPYPLNRGSIIKHLTLGLVDLEPKITGSGISADSIVNNALLYKASGRL